MRILFTTLGTGGDVYPFLAIARELTARGHEPVLATGEVHRETVEARGIRYFRLRPSVDPEDDELFARIMHPRFGPGVGIREVLMPALRDSYEDVLAAARGADAIVTHPVAFAGRLAAEVTGLPWISIALAPFSFFSRADLPVIPAAPRLKSLEPLPGARRFLAWLYPTILRSWTKPVDELRAELGLPPRPGNLLLGGQHSPLLALGLFSPTLVSPRTDWPRSARLTGFPFDDAPTDADGESARLERFLDAGAPPVVFTLGTSVVRVAGPFFTESLEAARRAGRRAVLLVGDDPANRPVGIDDDAIAVARAPYHTLFPRAALIVHHGGIGTLGQALRAGRPMLIVPRSHDQPDNAYRAERLGVARVLLRPLRYRARRVARDLRALLEDPEPARRAAEAAETVRGEDGVGAACDAIEGAVRER